MPRMRIGENETPEKLSARTGRPVCMLLRANRLASAAWLLPGREIIVPAGDFCRKDAGACPLALLDVSAETFAGGELPEKLPERLKEWSRTHGGAVLPGWDGKFDVKSLRPRENMAQFAARTGGDAAQIRRLNRYYGRPAPGVMLIHPRKNGV